VECSECRLLPNTAPLVKDTVGPASDPIGLSVGYVVAPRARYGGKLGTIPRSFDSRYFETGGRKSGARTRTTAPDGPLNGMRFG